MKIILLLFNIHNIICQYFKPTFNGEYRYTNCKETIYIKQKIDINCVTFYPNCYNSNCKIINCLKHKPIDIKCIVPLYKKK